MKRIIEWSVNRPSLVNILMVFLLCVGMYYAIETHREIFPEFSLDKIQISVVYKGASAEEIEESICVKIEEQIAGLEGIKTITSRAVEGVGSVTAELYEDADVRKILDDIKNEVDQIDTFPKDSESPVTVEVTQKRPVIRLAVAGDVSEHVLKASAEQIRDDLMEMAGISQVELIGDREHEVLIEIAEETLRKYSLTLPKIADLIRSNSLDLPGGTLESKSGTILVRTKGQLYTAREFKDLVVLSRNDGTVVTLGELARITDTFEDVDVQPRMNGKPAIVVSVDKTSDEDALHIADTVRAYVEKQNMLLPEKVRLTIWSDDSTLIRSRLNLLAKNGLQGLAVVFIILSLFLRLRLAFWVSVGIPVSMIGSFVYLGMTDFTLNMLTMFSFIVVLGVVVDDAIVIGENVYTKLCEGVPPIKAAIEGTAELWAPVANSVATTIVAFAPMLFVAGTMGKLMRVFPVAIIAVLIVSLLEALLILPAHLAHMRAQEDMSKRWSLFVIVERIRLRFDEGLTKVVEHYFVPTVECVIRHRYVFCAALIAVFIFVVGLVASGRIPFVLFPKTESDILSVKIVFPEGTNFQTTLDAVKQAEVAAQKLAELNPRKDGKSIVENVFSVAGEEMFGKNKGSHLAEMIMVLLPSEERDIPSSKLAAKWRELTGNIQDAVSVTFSTEMPNVPRPGGTPIEIRIMGNDLKQLRAAASTLKAELATFEGVEDIQDSYRPAKKEFRLSLRKGARQMGIQLSDLARQTRAAFWGEEALKIQRGRNEVTVRVRYPEYGRSEPGDLEKMKIMTPAGSEIPFSHIAEIREHQGPAIIERIHRKRAITVTADIDEEKANAEQIVNTLSIEFFDKLRSSYPGIALLTEGQKKAAKESLGSLRKGFIVAVFVIYVLLVNQFRTYTHPIVIMVAIPFSFVGVVVGHLVFGLALTILSMFGVLALAGIVVNDSILLVHATNMELDHDVPLQQALVYAARGRFRQIVLTSLSTIGGLTPILAETSFQAQFLKPMTVSVVFGLLFSTVLILLFVPSLIVIRQDILEMGTTNSSN